MSQEEKKPRKGPRRIKIAGPEDEQPEQPVQEQGGACEQAPSDEVAPGAGEPQVATEEEQEAPEDAPAEEIAAEQDEAVAAEIERLRNTLKEFELKCAEAEQDRQRIAAELHNFKRRARQEREVAIRLANERLLADLIPTLDTFELAMRVEPDSPAAASILEGINMVFGQLRSALQMHGVEQISAQGQMFDPSLHEAMEREESAESESGTILAELAKGYTLNGQVVRAAKVRVATAPADETAGEGGEGTGEGNGNGRERRVPRASIGDRRMARHGWVSVTRGGSLMKVGSMAGAAIGLLTWASGPAAAQRPVVTTADDAVSLAIGEQVLTASLEDGWLSLRTPHGDCEIAGSFLHRDGWASPRRAKVEPVIEEGRGGVRVVITYPLVGGREVELELSAYRDLPAVFVVCRLRRLRTIGPEYYFWQSNVTFDHYFTAGHDGPERVECDTEVWDPIDHHDWLFVPRAKGGLAVFPTNVSGRAPGQAGCMYLHALPKGRTIEPGDALETSFGLAGVATPEEAAALFEAARKRGIPALDPWARAITSCDYGRPAPKWLQEAEICSGYYRPPSGWTDEVVDGKLRGFPFIIGSTPGTDALGRCHDAGVRLLHYVVSTCLLDTGMQVREGGTVYSEWLDSVDNESRDLRDHPDWICINADGEVQKDGWGQAHGHPGLLNTCLHQAGLHEAATRQVDILMRTGYDGVFVDLAGPTVECHGPEYGKHSHPDPSTTNTEAYDDLLKEIYVTAKRHGSDRIVVHNGVTSVIPGHWPYADAQTLEAFPFGGESPQMLATWPEMRWQAARAMDARRHGKLTIMLPYFSKFAAGEAKRPALFSYAYARLYGLLWADYFTLADVEGNEEFARELYAVRLGRPRSGVRETDGVLFREFARGIVVLNPQAWEAEVAVPTRRRTALVDVGHDAHAAPEEGGLTVRMAPISGRVLNIE